MHPKAMTSAEKNIKKNSKSKTHFSGDYSLKLFDSLVWRASKNGATDAGNEGNSNSPSEKKIVCTSI